MAAIGRLGALLVRLHHDFDPQRFLSATTDTERAYAAFLGGAAQGAERRHSGRREWR